MRRASHSPENSLPFSFIQNRILLPSRGDKLSERVAEDRPSRLFEELPDSGGGLSASRKMTDEGAPAARILPGLVQVFAGVGVLHSHRGNHLHASC